jgi:hypothetical protein
MSSFSNDPDERRGSSPGDALQLPLRSESHAGLVGVILALPGQDVGEACGSMSDGWGLSSCSEIHRTARNMRSARGLLAYASAWVGLLYGACDIVSTRCSTVAGDVAL